MSEHCDMKQDCDLAYAECDRLKAVNAGFVEALDNLQACSTTALTHHGQAMKNSVRRDLIRSITDARVAITKARLATDPHGPYAEDGWGPEVDAALEAKAMTK